MARLPLGLCIPLLALSLTAQASWAEGSGLTPSYSTVVDWAANTVTIDASVSLAGTSTILPNARTRAEQAVRNDKASLTQSAFFPILADSYNTVGDLAASNPARYSALEDLVSPTNEQYAKMSADLKSLTVQYVLPLFPNLASVFVDQVHPNPPQPLLSYVPTTKFTGIVIYAAMQLPVHGDTTTALLNPCLFPKIWDENMNLLASANTVDPSALRKWGLAAYSASTDETPYTLRIGLNPYHTAATGIFGKHDTDVIISNEAAARILASKENISLLTQGKVLIIADPRLVTGGK
ncbi:MAG TPA: hypothetical protein VMV68_08215 [Spirochaetia bacterium]|nr:hypothetical protein [Spirochaetia bacterium]